MPNQPPPPPRPQAAFGAAAGVMVFLIVGFFLFIGFIVAIVKFSRR
jgi:hypothetical protein